jgi:hypothetical protein
VDIWTFARDAFSVTSRTKNVLFAGTLGVDPLVLAEQLSTEQLLTNQLTTEQLSTEQLSQILNSQISIPATFNKQMAGLVPLVCRQQETEQ